MDPIVTLAAMVILILAAGCTRSWRYPAPVLHGYSIIIPCRNEEDNLPDLCAALEKIDYPADKYEIILLDHASEDKTASLLKKFCSQAPNRKFIHLPENENQYMGKKQALHVGVNNSYFKIILFTDADCLPPMDWLKMMNQYFSPNTGMVVGYSPEKEVSGFRSFSQLMSATVYCSTIGLELPFSSNGRNLAIRRSVFEEVAGFDKIKDHPCGEDKQLLQLVSKTNYRIAYNARNKVFTKPVRDGFVDQQKRRYGQFGISSHLYKLASILIFFFYLYLPIILILGSNLVNFFIYFLPLIIFWFISLQKHKESFHWQHVIYLLIYPYYLIFFSLYGMFTSWSWKK